MKTETKATNIICIILVQLIIIDILLILCFFKKTDIAVKQVFRNKIFLKHKETGESVAVKQISQTGKDTSKVKNEVKEFSVIKDFINRFDPDMHLSNELKPAGRNLIREKFVATAYDLSYECCGKYPSHPEYGITFSGKKAVKGRTVAVDPEVIPLGSKVYIEFTDKYRNLNGWYIAEDTGKKVKGNIIDIFFGESAYQEAKEFGRRKINVEIVYPDGNKNNN